MLFHRWDFLKIIEKYTGYRLLTCGIYKGEELVSILPLYYKRKKGLSFVYSPPQTTLSYVPYMGFALGPGYPGMRPREKEDLLCYIIGEADRAIKSLSPNYLSLTVASGNVDVRPYLWNGYGCELQYTYYIDLERPPEKVLGSFEKNCRQDIAAASKLNLSIERSNDAAPMFGMMRERLASVGNTFFHRQSPAYVNELLDAFPDNLKMYCLYNGDDFTGAAVNCEYKGHCIGWMGTASAKGGINVNEYLLWEVMKKYRAAGCRIFENLGADELRLNTFKSKFNPTLVPYFYAIKKDRLFRAASYGSEKLARILA
jgi:hypothetical protein